jgi:hypothetical protein
MASSEKGGACYYSIQPFDATDKVEEMVILTGVGGVI